MHHMRYIILSFLLLAFSACTWNTISNHTIPVWLPYYVVEAKHGFEIVYDPQATYSVKEYYESGKFILNGSYFWMTPSGWYYPAGLWISNPRKESLKIQSHDIWRTDPNLDTIVAQCDGKWELYTLDGFLKTFCNYTYAFQTWPLVINEWWITSSFSGSWHANEPHERTMMAKTHDGNVFFIIFSSGITLSDAGKKIMSDPLFSGKDIDVVNLDGWPSTAYYDGTYGFRENENLPIILRVRR